jgi:hypothetical protein
MRNLPVLSSVTGCPFRLTCTDELACWAWGSQDWSRARTVWTKVSILFGGAGYGGTSNTNTRYPYVSWGSDCIVLASLANALRSADA